MTTTFTILTYRDSSDIQVRSGESSAFLFARGPQQDPEDGALADLAFDLEHAAMAVDDVLDDGKAEPGAAHRPRARGIDAVEALGEARYVLAPDPLAMVAHGDGERRRTLPPLDEPAGDLDRRPLPAIFDGIVDKVLKYLGELVGLALRLGELGGEV